MYESTQDDIWMHGIDLAQESDFDLGSLRVRPARCEVEWKGVIQTLQRRVMQVLVALAQARGAVVSQGDLVVRCWRGLSVSDDAIYRCISKLRKLAADYPEPPYAIEAIPGVGYRLTSAERSGGEQAVMPTETHDRRVRLGALAAVALAILALVTATVWTFRGRLSDDHRTVRIAVQPFDALTNSDDARALARRIPDEIVNEFGDSQIATVLTAEQAAAASNRSPGLTVTGLVRADAPNVSVDVRVEDGISHAALWSMEFKRDGRAASDLPMEVAARVGDVVNMAIFARTANPPLTDDSALSALLETTDMIRGSQDGDWAQMIERAKRVVERHPEFAFGHDVLAVGYAEASLDVDIPDRARAFRDAARSEANLTLKLDPEDAGAYAVLSGLVAPYDHRQREEILLRGIRFAKHPKQPLAALASYQGVLLADVGRLREALSFQLVAHAADEWGPPRTNKLVVIYADMGNLNAARDALQKAAQLWPNHPGVWRVQQYVAGFYEPPPDALKTFELLDARSSLRDSNTIWRAFVEAKAHPSRQMADATSLKIRMAADQGTISRENEIMMLAGLGEIEQAIEVSNSALDHHELLEPWFLFTPVTRRMRTDLGFLGLATRLGLVQYWRDTGRWPDFCTDRTDECTPQLRAAIKSR